MLLGIAALLRLCDASIGGNRIIRQHSTTYGAKTQRNPRPVLHIHVIHVHRQRMSIIALLDTPNAVQSQKVLALISIGKLSDGLYLLLPS